MSRRYLTVTEKRLMIERAMGRCEYCKCLDDYSLQSFDFDHIHPVSQGGQTSPENLAYACGGCNAHKHTKTWAIDPETGVEVNLYNPRQERWEDHFEWNVDLLQIFGVTAVGQSTVSALQLNRRGVMNVRKLLILEGKHPPD
jgi:5-methylcytosine-specific restriction endonuclease McrA